MAPSAKITELLACGITKSDLSGPVHSVSSNAGTAAQCIVRRKCTTREAQSTTRSFCAHVKRFVSQAAASPQHLGHVILVVLALKASCPHCCIMTPWTLQHI